MRIEETKTAGTVANGAAGDKNWTPFFGQTLAESVGTSDNKRVTSALANGETTKALECSDFGFSLPLRARISGEQVRTERNASAITSIKDHEIKLLLADGTLGGTDKSNAAHWDSTDEIIDHPAAGAEDDDWDEYQTGADLDDADSGCSIRAKNWNVNARTAGLDYVELTAWADVPVVSQPTIALPFLSVAGNYR